MDIGKIKELAEKHLKNRKAHLEREKGFIYYHGIRVSKLSLKLREIIIPEDNSYDEIIEVASLFHDVSKGIEPHGKYGALLIKEILKDCCSEEELDKIAELIRCHQLRKKRDDYSDYIKILQDADILDHYGTVEIWMNFQYYAHKDEPMENSVNFYKNECSRIAKRCRDELNYDISKKIFDDKVDFIYSFVERFEAEAKGEFYMKIDN